MGVFKGSVGKVLNRHNGRLENCTVGVGCKRHFHETNVKNVDAGLLNSLNSDAVSSDGDVSSWLRLESFVEGELRDVLPAGYVVEGLGVSNSNTTDVKVSNVLSGDVFGVEVKQLPSAAGVQLVVVGNGDGFVMSDANQVGVDYLAQMLGLVNKHYGVGGKSLGSEVKLSGADKQVACEIFAEKHSTMSPVVKMVAVSTVKNVKSGFSSSKLAAVPSDAVSIGEAFNFTLSVRGKKSGSSRANSKTVSEFNRVAEVNGWEVTVVHRGGKHFVAGLNDVDAANTVLKNDRLYVNPKGELRKLGVTNNTTALLALTVGESYNKFEGNFKTAVKQQLA